MSKQQNLSDDNIVGIEISKKGGERDLLRPSDNMVKENHKG